LNKSAQKLWFFIFRAHFSLLGLFSDEEKASLRAIFDPNYFLIVNIYLVKLELVQQKITAAYSPRISKRNKISTVKLKEVKFFISESESIANNSPQSYNATNHREKNLRKGSFNSTKM
jgi:hypothetical protein